VAKSEVRIGALAFCLMAGCAAMVAQAGYLQLVRGGELAAKAKSQRTVKRELEPHRGTLYDRNEIPLALSFERYHLGVNPARVRKQQPDSILRIVRADLGISTKRLKDAFASGRYFYSHGPYSASQVERLRAFRAVELVSTYRRSYPLGALARPLIGSVPVDSGVELTGLERFLDSLLRGDPGEAVLLRAADRREYESPGRVLRRPVAGHDVYLTIDRELQEIAEAALQAAFAELEPDRGDIVFLDPRSGEVLAAASRVGAGRDSSGVAAATFFWNYFEPGSTAKPFTAAALLELDKVSDGDTVSGDGGEWWPEGRQRPIRDDHPQKGPITLQRAVEVSSNVGMAKFASRLSPVEHYDALRRFGFGTPTGIEFTAERGGVLPRPARWRTGQQGPSVAMGYAFEVTPIQLAAAYGAIANDGLLMQPSLVREIRDGRGRTIYRHEPTVVRRAVSREVAAKLRRYLALATGDSGTGRKGQVVGGVLGKTGTARLVVGSRYANRYAASFAAIYPAEQPQLVVVVRIENPKSAEYYGGQIAAPITAKMLRQAIAAERAPIDRGTLAERAAPTPRASPDPEGPNRPAVVVPWPIPREAGGLAPAAEVPNVVGKSVREAAYLLHRRGFRVRLEGGGLVETSRPAAGVTLTTGRTVTIVARERR